MNTIYNQQNVQKWTFCKWRIPEWNRVSHEWMFYFRWALRWPVGSLEERGRGRASAWSWLLTPRCSFWMNQPRGWTPVPPTLSCYCWKGTKKKSLQLIFSNPNLEASLIFKLDIFSAKIHIYCTNLKMIFHCKRDNTCCKITFLYMWMLLDSCLQDGESRKNHNHVHPPTTVLHLQTVWHPDSAGQR